MAHTIEGNATLVQRMCFTLWTATLSLAVLGCGHVDRPDGWTEATHGKDTPPNYDLLFAMDRVHEVRITIASSDYQAMQQDLAQLVAGEEDVPPPPPPEAFAACQGKAASDACSFVTSATTLSGRCQPGPGEVLVCVPDGMPPPGQGDPGDLDKLIRDPIYVPVEVVHDGHTWWHVGMRYKGNSSLATSFEVGIAKLPFRLDYDHFEDEHREIHDQRFYGFRELSFSSNWGDDSQVRECFVKEVFRDRGVPAPRCAFYRVFVDVGGGPEYWGLYSAVDDPDDGAMLDSQFGGRGGNLYKPEGAGADWTHFDRSGFEKKSNVDEADWSDVQGAIEALHSDEPDAASYRAGLEARFDAPLFLGWLAVNTVLYNWDGYGRGAHNYYLYGDPGRGGQLRWIPWDHNLAMMRGQPGSAPPDGPPPDAVAATAEVFHSEIGAEWPLISRLLQDASYAQLYRDRVAGALEGRFAETEAIERVRSLHELIAPYVVGDEGERAPYSALGSSQAFESSIDGAGGLAEHIRKRHALVRMALEARASAHR